MMNFFLHNSYCLNERDQIIKAFKKISYHSSISLIMETKKRCIDFLSTEKDPLIRNIHVVCEGLTLLKCQQIKKAKKHVDIVWEQLSKQDHLYFSETLVLKNMLFLFSADTAEEMMVRSIREWERYESLYETADLQVSILVNYCYILVRNNKIEKAMEILKTGKELCIKKKRSDLLCDINSYIAICCYVTGKMTTYQHYLREVLLSIYLVSDLDRLEDLVAELASFVTAEEVSNIRKEYEKLEIERNKFAL